MVGPELHVKATLPRATFPNDNFLWSSSLLVIKYTHIEEVESPFEDLVGGVYVIFAIFPEWVQPPGVVHTETRPTVVVSPKRQQVPDPGRCQSLPIKPFGLLDEPRHGVFSA